MGKKTITHTTDSGLTGKTAKKGSKTSSFGTRSRINHDASQYYRSKLNSELPVDVRVTPVEDQLFPIEFENKIIRSSSERMQEIPDQSVHLMVTSPPYNVTKDYDADLTLDEYLQILRNVFTETYRVLVHGGRACVNVANLGRRPYIPLSDYISRMMLEIGFNMRGEIIWSKGAAAGISMAWGSWQSASNPVLRDTHEYILVFSKGSLERKKTTGKENTISKEQFMEWTKSVWSMTPESARKVGHPAPFPVELPYRLIQLYTYQGDVVLDPFMGSGTTALAALKAGRKYIGYEIDPEYTQLAEKRIGAFRQEYLQPVLSKEDIFTWIDENLKPELCTSDRFIYDDMESQSGRCLPLIYTPFDPGNRSHWRDRGALYDFLFSTRGEGKKLLDFGPGDGWPSLIVAPFVSEVVGVDGSRRRVGTCLENAARMGILNAQFTYVEPGTRLPFEDHSFDGVMAASSVEQSPDPFQTLQELFRVLKPGGCLRIRYESLNRYRGSREHEVWFPHIDDPICRLVLFDRHIDQEFALQYRLTFSIPREDLIRRLWGETVPGPFEKITIECLAKAREHLVNVRVCKTIHPSGTTLAGWLRDIGFKEVLPTYNGIEYAGQLFDALPEGQRPETMAGVDQVLISNVKVLVEMQAPLEMDPMITAIK